MRLLLNGSLPGYLIRTLIPSFACNSAKNSRRLSCQSISSIATLLALFVNSTNTISTKCARTMRRQGNRRMGPMSVTSNWFPVLHLTSILIDETAELGLGIQTSGVQG